MGNTNCVAGGGTPHRADIVIANNIKYELELNEDEYCGRYCKHRGFKVTDGKIVEGHLPPKKIAPFSKGEFSVSGRESTAVAPKGKAYYRNSKVNLHIIFEWAYSGWTSPGTFSGGKVTITGIPPKEEGWFALESIPWNQVLKWEFDAKTWTYEIKERQGFFAEAQEALGRGPNLRIEL